ncbi:unnamed protein product [Echinostoma caproni]|uniref:Protein kinase domain-containing protein n=1 Tax=Echinostoma caproni TaxID=27848 RepID=A0A183AE51_9TREM|nr:unnamed protein product [Echinostoma caproni]
MEDVPVRSSVHHGSSEPSVPAAVDQNSFTPAKDLKPKRANGEEPVISSRVRERLAASGELLPRLKLRDRNSPLNSLKLSENGSVFNRSTSSGPTPTPTTASFGASADTFGFLKQDSEARHLLALALKSEKKPILTSWHYLISHRSGVHLPIPPSSTPSSAGPNSVAANRVAFKSPSPVPPTTANVNGKGDGTEGSVAFPSNRDAFELELLEYQGGLPGTVSLPNSPLLFEFIRIACLMMWAAFEKPLCAQLSRPHELLAWHKLIGDAVAVAVNNLTALDEYGDVRHPGLDGMLPEGRVLPLRRHRTFAVRGGGGSSQVRDELLSRKALTQSQDQFEPNTPLRSRVRPMSMAYHSNDRQRTLSFDYLQPNETAVTGPIPTDADTAARRRASFARASERSSLFQRSTGNLGNCPLAEDLNEDSPSLKTVDMDTGQSLFGTTAHLRPSRRYAVMSSQIEEEREETERLSGELLRLSTQHNRLLTAMIRQRQSEVDNLRALAPEAVTYNQVCKLTLEFSLFSARSTRRINDFLPVFAYTFFIHPQLNSQGITNEEDFLRTATKDDLWRLNLSGGAILRIWNKLSELRQAASITAVSQL